LLPAVIVDKPERTSLVDFFEALPTDFACFDHLFGYSESEGPAPMYSQPQLHFLFPKIAVVLPQDVYIRKLIGLSIHAKWQADQTGALQDATRLVLDTETPLFVRFLGELDAESERSVWAFLFGGPHPSNEPLEPSVQKRICEASVRSCVLLREEYAHALSEEHTH
jgi:hypothetical protein